MQGDIYVGWNALPVTRVLMRSDPQLQPVFQCCDCRGGEEKHIDDDNYISAGSSTLAGRTGPTQRAAEVRLVEVMLDGALGRTWSFSSLCAVGFQKLSLFPLPAVKLDLTGGSNGQAR